MGARLGPERILHTVFGKQFGQSPVGVEEPHFKVFPEFEQASYGKRYELFCRRLVLERHYDCAAFMMSDATAGLEGAYLEPADDLKFERFAQSLVAHVAAYTGKIRNL